MNAATNYIRRPGSNLPSPPPPPSVCKQYLLVRSQQPCLPTPLFDIVQLAICPTRPPPRPPRLSCAASLCLGREREGNDSKDKIGDDGSRSPGVDGGGIAEKKNMEEGGEARKGKGKDVDLYARTVAR